MSANVVMINADAYIGIVAAHARNVTTQSVKENDTRRLILIKLILPSIMKKDFIDRVITSQENFCKFSINLQGPNSPLLPSDLDYLDTTDLSPEHQHTAYYQNFAQITDSNIPVGMTPWQIRFDFAKPILNTLLTLSPALAAEITSIFERNGWTFWLTDTGFTISPLNLYKNLKSVSDAFLTWMEIRYKPLADVSPQFATASAPQTDSEASVDTAGVVCVQ
jgi:hypothetical protein